MRDERLLPFQQNGVSKLVQLLRANGSALLADPPGAGKSAQAVRVLLELRAGSVLILCPASLRIMWRRELEKWGWFNATTVLASASGVNGAPLPPSAICSYDLAAREPVLSALSAREWDVLVLDESHYCRSPDAARTKAALITLWSRARYRLALTGTPVPNGRASEAWPLFARMAPDLFTPWAAFAERYCVRVETEYGVTYPRSRNLEELGRLARERFMVRRSREECMVDLPPLRREIVPLAIPEEQVREVQAGLNDISPEMLADVVRAVDAGLTVLNYGGMSYVRRVLGELKAPAAIEFIRTLRERDDGARKSLVVFAHHRTVVSALAAALAEDAAVVTVTGDDSAADRQAAVDAFQAGSAEVLVASITAASTGLTLTRASTVVFVEADWVPSTNEQAEGRVLRRTQNAMLCRALYLVVPGSMDDAVTSAVVRKQRDISRLLGEPVEGPRESSPGNASEGFTAYPVSKL
jgi:SWI/SNF-related matrix-associated actin-dependent regulator 1 of chromatin subfamily A